MNKKILVICFSAFLTLGSVSVVQAEEQILPIPKISDSWTVDVTPY